MWHSRWTIARWGGIVTLAVLLAGQARAADPASALLAQLQALAPQARAKMVQTLAAAQNPHLIQPLVTLLMQADAPFAKVTQLDGIPYVDVINNALCRYGAAAVQPLANALKSAQTAGQRSLLIDALASTHVSAAVAPLLELAKHPPAGYPPGKLVAEVGTALRRLGDAGMTALTSLLAQGDDNSRLAAARSLVESGKRAIPYLKPLITEKLNGAGNYARWALAEIGPAAIPILIEALLDPDALVRRWAINALVMWNDPAAYDAVLGRLGDADPQVRLAAAAALGHGLMQDPRAAANTPNRAVDPLIRLLQDPDPQVRASAADALGALGDHRALAPLRAMLGGSANFNTGIAAAALGMLKDPRANDTLLAVAKSFDHPERRAAVLALQYINDPRAADVLAFALKDTDPRVRAAAIQGLGALRASGAVDPLIQILKSDNDGMVRAAAAFALGYFSDSRATEALFSAWSSDNRDLRLAAAQALGASGDPRALELLLGAKSARDRDLVLAGLGASRDPRAVQKLLVALKDSDVTVRARAAEGLGKSGDINVVTPLITALKDTSEHFDALRRVAPVRQAAATALGQLKDRRAIDPLITALADRAPDVARNAAASLTAITGLRLGYDPAAWRAAVGK